MESHFSNFTHLSASVFDLLDWTDPALYVGLHTVGGIYHGKWKNKLHEHNVLSSAGQCHLHIPAYQPSSNSCATTSLNWLWYSFHEVSYLLRKYMLNTVVSKRRRRNSPTLSDSVTWKGGCIPLPPYFKSRTTFGIAPVTSCLCPYCNVCLSK